MIAVQEEAEHALSLLVYVIHCSRSAKSLGTDLWTPFMQPRVTSSTLRAKGLDAFATDSFKAAKSTLTYNLQALYE